MQIEPTRSFVQAFMALPMLRSLDNLYPDFGHWYINKVIPGVVLGTDKLLMAKEDGRLVGVALGKKTDSETKLRCVRVLPEYQNTGLGVRLIDQMLENLECEQPHCTVAEELFHTYSRLFVRRYGFRLNDVMKGAYRPQKLEYSFN